jgi:hypothetical protein
MFRIVAAGLMLLSVLMLSAAQVPFGVSGHPHSHAAHHPIAAAQAAGQASMPCTGHCDFDEHGVASCVATCTVASASLPMTWTSAIQPLSTRVSYRAAFTGSLVGVAPDPALRPPERIG